ncbi:MAG: hypothetical protein AVDCRST_MAG93-6870, partial [uncultured Chloroflexia bacterium]
ATLHIAPFWLPAVSRDCLTRQTDIICELSLQELGKFFELSQVCINSSTPYRAYPWPTFTLHLVLH